MTNIAIFVSGNGTNCENIIRYFRNSDKATVSVVVSNKADAYALVRARKYDVPCEVIDKAMLQDREYTLKMLAGYNTDFIVLAGFLLMIPDYLIEAFPRKIINLHPALLPKYGGKGMYGHHVHEAVKQAGETETGMTVHYVSNVCDGGEIIAQYTTPISPDDSIEEIAAKEQALEQQYFPEVIDSIL